MIAFFWFIFGAGFALLAVAAGVTVHVRRRDAYARVPVVDDALLEQIIENALIFHEEGRAPRVLVQAAVEGPTLVVKVRLSSPSASPQR